jgi:Tfp pilus assembly PilM family ATPase
MKTKIGSYIHENLLDIVIGQPSESIVIETANSYDLKVASMFENLSIDDEKNLEQASSNIQKSLLSQRLSERDTNIVVPDEQCSLQIIKLPLVSEKEIVSAIELQSEEFVPYPIEKASFDYQILSIDKEHNSMYLLLVVALKEHIDKISNYILNLGLYPVGLETETTALIRLILGGYLKMEDRFNMIVNIGPKTTQITILNYQQKQLVTTNSINLGYQFFYRALQNNLNIPVNSAKEIFAALKATDANYQKIIKPIFSEYANQIQQILITAFEKIGTLPSRVYLFSSQPANTYSVLFKDHPVLSQYSIFNLTVLSPDSLKAKYPEAIKDKLGYYLVPLGAII